MLWNPKHDQVHNEVKGLLDLSKPSIQALSYALRNKETWPKGFEWRFYDCDHCAMGLAKKLWYFAIEDNNSKCLGKVLGIPWGESHRIFLSAYLDRKTNKITPEMVADELDKLIA